MFGRSRATELKNRTFAASELAAALAQDKKFRKQMIGAAKHGSLAKRRAAERIGVLSVVGRLATDPELRGEIQRMLQDLQAAWNRLESKRHRGHGVRNTVLLLTGAGGAALLSRQRAGMRRMGGTTGGMSGGTSPRVVDASVEVEVPVSTAYNQWTQFEEFPRFMKGVDEVRQLDDTRLHWVSSVGGKRAEWDAKILEQHPDSQISWVSEDGKKTRGTVSFESLGESRTLVRLSMSYQVEGFVEAIGSAAGADKRRVEGDLQRFKELIEAREAETGAWRGDISAGNTT
jgi:uncharacterized membrane protein